jgi:hypothetical protein
MATFILLQANWAVINERRSKAERAPVARTGALVVGPSQGGFSDQYLVTGGPQLKR